MLITAVIPNRFMYSARPSWIRQPNINSSLTDYKHEGMLEVHKDRIENDSCKKCTNNYTNLVFADFGTVACPHHHILHEQVENYMLVQKFIIFSLTV